MTPETSKGSRVPPGAPRRQEPIRPAPAARRFSILALGCRVNQDEMECLRSQLLARGYEEVPFGAPADLSVVNTCTVTQAGDSDSRQMLRRARRASPHGRVVATGCYAQRDPLALASLGAADMVLGNRQKSDLDRYLELIDAAAPGTRPRSCSEIVVSPIPSGRTFLAHAAGQPTARTRATIKIQDGCDEHCTYCIIPRVRGPSVSRPRAQIVEEARRLVATGTREITLTGVNSGSYGLDGAPGAAASLAELLDDLERIVGLERIRLGSVEPGQVDERLVARFAVSRKLCPHLHVPLQSGDDGILKRMGRTYRTGDYAEMVDRLRRAVPGVALGTDVMAGFPGETWAEFQRSLAFLERVGFAYLHVFSYSPRPGTAAERLRADLDPDERSRRSRILRDLDRELRRRHMARRRGQRDLVLVERVEEERALGLTGDYLRAVLRGRTFTAGRTYEVTIGDPEGDRCVAVVPVGEGPIVAEAPSR